MFQPLFAEHSQSTNITMPAEPDQPAQPTEPTELAKPDQPTQPAQPTEPTSPAEPAHYVQTTHQIDTTQSTESTETTQKPQCSHHSQFFQTSLPTQFTRKHYVFENRSFPKLSITNDNLSSISSNTTSSNPHHISNRENYTPLDYFIEYFDDDFFEQIAVNTNKYYRCTKNKELNATLQEIKTFVGIHLLTLTERYKKFSHYFNKNLNFKQTHHLKNVNVNRLFLLRNFLSIANTNCNSTNNSDNNIIGDDNKPPLKSTSTVVSKIFEIEPLIDKIRNKCKTFPRTSKQYTIFQQSIPFSGICPVRLYTIKNKPCIKLLMIIADNGLILDIDIQQESSPTSSVVKICKTLPKYSQVFTNEQVTSIELLDALLNINVFGTGRLEQSKFQQQHKNQIEFLNDFHRLSYGETIEYTRNDNKMCLVGIQHLKPRQMMLSTIHSTPEISNSSNKKPLEILHHYDSCMAKTNQSSEVLKSFLQSYNTNRWSVKIVNHLFLLVVINCWLVYKFDCEVKKESPMTVYQFITSIASSLISATAKTKLTKGSKNMTRTKRKRSSNTTQHNNKSTVDEPPQKKEKYAPLPSMDIRTDGLNHLPVPKPIKCNKRCRLRGCKNRTKTLCAKCNVFLCLTPSRLCFNKFHNMS